MKLKSVLLIVGSCSLFCIYGFIKKSNSSKNEAQSFVDRKMLWGKWLSTKDSKSILIFDDSVCKDSYGAKIIDSLHYLLSISCNRSDSSKSVDLATAHLIFFNDDSSLKECNEVLTLDKTTLSYMNSTNGSIHIINKVR